MSYKKLYILGNGFDLRHGILSNYADFKEFLRGNNWKIFRLVEEYLPVGDDWSSLESAFGEIDVDYMVETNSVFLPSYAAADWSDSGHHDFQYEIGSIVSCLSEILIDEFANWIKQIKIPDAASAKNTLSTLDVGGLYLSFNYTSTLRSVYSVSASNILYLHGAAAISDSHLVLGHAWSPNERRSLNDRPDIEGQDTRVTEAYDIIDSYFSATFKPSAEIILKNEAFFAELGEVEEIFVLGHSMSDVDHSYFDEVVRRIKVDTVRWVIACREEDECSDKYSIVTSLGVPSDLIKTALWQVL